MSTVTYAAQALTGIPHLASVIAADVPVVDNPRADFSDTPWWLHLVKALLVFVFLLVNTLLVIWFERRVIGRMQQRPGPNRTGPFGLLQTLADGIKLALKEDLTPRKADKVVFALAPAIAGAMAFVSFAIIPMGPSVWMFGHHTPLQLTDIPVAVLLVLAVAGVGVYGIVLAGLVLRARPTRCSVACARPPRSSRTRSRWACRSSPCSSTAARCRPRRSSTPSASLWYIVPAFFSFFVYVVTMVGETNRLPFDLAEGEGELTGGFHTEYSSLKFAMFFLGEYVNMFTVSALATTMFLGGWQAPPGIAAIDGGLFNHGWWGLLWFVIKLWLFMFVFVWLRGSLPRVRYDQFMRFGWRFLIPVTLAWVVVVAFIRASQLGFIAGPTFTLAGRQYPLLSFLFVVVVAAGCPAGLLPVGGQGRRGAGCPGGRPAGGDRPVCRWLPRAAAPGPAAQGADPGRQ